MKKTKNEIWHSRPKIVKNLQTILQNTAFCTVCFDTDGVLLHLDETLVKGDWIGDVLPLRNMLEGIFGNTDDLLFSDYICERCKSSAASSYAFITKTRRTSQIFTEYLAQLDKEIIELGAMTDNEWKHAMIVLEDYDCIIRDIDKIRRKKEKMVSCFCNFCSKGFSCKRDLSKHLKQHEIGTVRPVNCPHCVTRPCIHERYLEAFNEQRKQKLDKITCIECNDEIGRTIPHLIAHVNKEHLNINTNICEECGKSFYLECDYKKHYKYYHNTKTICKFCFRRFKSEKYLKSHEITCKNTEKPFKCDKCPILSETKASNQFHMVTHLRQYSKKVLKPSTESTKGRIYKCKTCDKILKTKLELRVHIGKHEKKPNLCVYCNKQFGSRKEYLEHAQTQEHRNNVPYNMLRHNCLHCDYAANSAAMLTAHVNRIHLNIRPFQCEFCQKCYFDSVQLKNHMKIHTGQAKLKVCDICGAHLAGPTALKKHRRLHTGEKPYSCPYCDEKTNCASTLKTHIMRKHMEATIKCPLCDQKFHTMNNARGHVTKVHWKSKEKFDYTKLKGLLPKDYDFFRDRRKALL